MNKEKDKILILSDLHHGRSDSNYHIKYQTAFLKKMKKFIKKNDIDYIINLGDSHDRRMSGSIKVFDIFSKLHYELADLVKKYYVIAGNHDCYYKTSNKITSLGQLFKHEKHVCIERRGAVIGDFVMVPWISKDNHDDIIELISKNNKQGKILCGHFEMSGFQFSSASGMKSKTDHLARDEYDKYDMVLSGHYHKKQTDRNIIYVGSPYQLTFGEIEKKFIHVIDNGKLNSTENKNDIFRQFVINDEESLDDVKEKVSGIKNKHVKVNILSSDSEFIDDVERIIDLENPYTREIKYKQNLDDSDVDIEDVDISEENILKEYFDKLDYNNEKEKKSILDYFEKYWKIV